MGFIASGIRFIRGMNILFPFYVIAGAYYNFILF